MKQACRSVRQQRVTAVQQAQDNAKPRTQVPAISLPRVDPSVINEHNSDMADSAVKCVVQQSGKQHTLVKKTIHPRSRPTIRHGIDVWLAHSATRWHFAWNGRAYNLFFTLMLRSVAVALARPSIHTT